MGLLELSTTAFGQGVSVTAIQQVAAVSAIVNGGTYYTPYIVKQAGNTKYTSKVKTENIITEETSNLVKYALESVVANGSGRNAYIDGYRIGGKTGTAQKVGEDGKYMEGNYILSFIGFMSAENPDYVVYIAIDNPKGVTQYGGVVAAPIAKNIFKQIISLKEIKSTNEGLPMSYRWNDIKYITIPEILGKTKKEVTKTLSNLGFNIEYSGTGNTVVDATYKEGDRVKEGSTIKLMLN